MKLDRQKLAPYAYFLGLLALVFSGGWYVVYRQFAMTLQISLAVSIAAVAAGILLDPDPVREFLRGRQARYGSNALLLTVSLAGILVVANYLVVQNEKSWDLTEDQQYSLAPETMGLLESLEHPVEIIGFYTPELARSRENVEPLLERYRQASDGRVNYRFVNPNRSPLEADRYGISRDGSLVVVVDERSEVVSFGNEREITSAILRVDQGQSLSVYFLTGHGERELAGAEPSGLSEARRAIEAKNYTTGELNLLAEGSIPAEAAAVVIAGQQRGMADEEIAALAEYLDRGGGLIVLFEPTAISGLAVGDDPLVGYLLDRWGIKVQDDLVVDSTAQVSLSVIAYSYGDHPITNRMGNLASYFPTVRSLAAPAGEEVRTTELVLSGAPSWGETGVDALTEEAEIGFDEGTEMPGPLPLGIAAEAPESGSRLVVFGDSDFASNSDFLNFGNGDLFVNSLDWLVGQEELIQLTPRDRTNRIVVPPSLQTLGLLFLLTVIVVPGSFVGLGLAAWWQRRRNR